MIKKKFEKQKKHNYKIIIGLLLGLALGSIGVYAATQIASSNVTYTNNNQENVQGAIDDLYSKTKDYNVCNANKNITTTKKCKRAEYLHQETCNRTDSYGCMYSGYTKNGSKKTTTITYGNCGTSGTLTAGDAFDCDVNGDGIYSNETERFYYISKYFNTETKQFEDSTAVLLYYSNVSNGNPSNKEFLYGTNNYEGPVIAMQQLPTTEQWSNISLKNVNRVILNEIDGDTSDNGNKKLSGSDASHPKFSYSGYAARLLTYQELKNAVWAKGFGSNDYTLEKTWYTNSKDYFLETPWSESKSAVYYVYGKNLQFDRVNGNDYSFGVRPAIEVSVNDIEY